MNQWYSECFFSSSITWFVIFIRNSWRKTLLLNFCPIISNWKAVDRDLSASTWLPLSGPISSRFSSWKYKTREYRIHERPWLYLDDSPKVPSQLLSSAAYAENSWSPPNPDSYPLSFLFSFFFSLYSRRNTRANFNISILPSTCTVHNCPFLLLSPLYSLSIASPICKSENLHVRNSMF